MARPTERRKTQREGVDLNDQAPVQLQSNRRFFQAGGYDKSVRAARALEQAFGTVSNAYVDIKNEQNAQGRQQAINENAAGRQRNEDEKNNAYHRQWDMLNAEYDFQKLATDLPEKLRQMDWENQPEAAVQEAVSTTMAGLFAGVENMKNSAYAEYLAPKLLEMETGLIKQHREMQIAKVKEEQRTQTFVTFTAGYESALEDWKETAQVDPELAGPRPLPDYATLFQRTGTFFDGTEKKQVFWESIYDLAIQMEDPSIIDNVPAQIMGTNGQMIPTGIEDPAMQDSHRAARTAAMTAAAHTQSKREAAQKEAYEQEVFDLQHTIVMKTLSGQDVSEELIRLRNNPEASYSDFTSSTTFAQGQIGWGEKRAADLPMVANLWQRVYTGNASIPDLAEAWANGVYGSGPQAVAQMEKMMETVRQVRDAASRSDGTLLTQTRTSVANSYNPQREGILKGLNTDLMYIQQAAVDEYNKLTLVDGVGPLDAAMQVREKYDPMVDRLSNAQSGSKWAVESGVITSGSAKALLSGDIDASYFVGNNTRSAVEESLVKMVEAKELEPEEAELILAYIY